jgi:hypothetical protein
MARSMNQDSAGEFDVIYALVLLQGGFGVLASFGVVGLMGSPVYLVAPLVKFAAMLFLAVRIARGRRWASITMIAVQSASVAGYLISLLISLFPAVTATVNLVGLITGLAVPAAVIWLCVRMLKRTSRPRPSAYLVVPPVSPWATPEANPWAVPGQTLTYTRQTEPPR